MLLKYKRFFMLLGILPVFAAGLGSAFASPPTKYGTAPVVNSNGTSDYTISSRIWPSQPNVPVHNWVMRLPNSVLVKNNWFSVEKIVTYCERSGGCHDEKKFDETNSYINFQLDFRAKSQFVLSLNDDDRNPLILIQFNDSANEDGRQSAIERLELGVCQQRKSELPGLTTQAILPATELDRLQNRHPGKNLDPCKGDEELGSFILRDKNNELLGSGYCGSGKRPCDVYLLKYPAEHIRILFHRSEFPYLQGHAEALVAFIHQVTVKGNRCYIRQGRVSDASRVADDSTCKGDDADILK